MTQDIAEVAILACFEQDGLQTQWGAHLTGRISGETLVVLQCYAVVCVYS